MLNKNDVILLLTDLENKGLPVNKQLTQLLRSESIPMDILKYINDNRPLEIVQFYDHIRKNHNLKKSPLYKNIVIEDLKRPSDVITILSSLLLQIALYASKLEDNSLFLKNSRAMEISGALNQYYNNFDLIPSLKLLKLIKVDLKAFESLK